MKNIEKEMLNWLGLSQTEEELEGLENYIDDICEDNTEAKELLIFLLKNCK